MTLVTENSGRRVSAIVAYDHNRAIGRRGELPWRLPDDLKHFKALTLGKTVLMGRKTWDSLGRPLPQRENWVLTRDPTFSAEGCRVFTRLENALTAHLEGELMVIGGAELYRQALPQVSRLYVTEVDTAVDGADAWFPSLAEGGWQELERSAHPADERHACPFDFITLERV